MPQTSGHRLSAVSLDNGGRNRGWCSRGLKCSGQVRSREIAAQGRSPSDQPGASLADKSAARVCPSSGQLWGLEARWRFQTPRGRGGTGVLTCQSRGVMPNAPETTSTPRHSHPSGRTKHSPRACDQASTGPRGSSRPTLVKGGRQNSDSVSSVASTVFSVQRSRRT